MADETAATKPRVGVGVGAVVYELNCDVDAGTSGEFGGLAAAARGEDNFAACEILVRLVAKILGRGSKRVTTRAN